MRTVLIEVERVEAETDLAFLLVIDGEKAWVPKSQIEDVDDIEVGDEGVELNIAEWIAEREGWV